MKRVGKILLLMLALFNFSIGKAQAVAGNVDLKVLVIGMTNRIEVACEEISRKNLHVYSPDFNLTDSMGFIFIKIPLDYKGRKHTTKLYFRDKRSKKHQWIDSVEFRVKRLPRPVAQLGYIRESEYYTSGEIGIQKSLYAYMENIWVQNTKATVESYQFHLRDFYNLNYISKKVTGNGTDELKRVLSSMACGNGAEIIFDSIKAVFQDSVYDLEPIFYKLKGNSEVMPGVFALVSYNGTTVYLNPDDRKTDIEGFPIRRQFYLSGSDTIPILERRDSAGQLMLFRRYHDSFPRVLQIENRRVSDSFFYCRYFNSKGVCIAEGLSATPMTYKQYTYNYPDNFTFPGFLEWWLGNNRLLPSGIWRFYYDNGQLCSMGNFCIRNPYKDTDEFGNTIIMMCPRYDFGFYGNWKCFERDGSLLKEYYFELDR